jgi:hypothetical protein
MYWTGNNPLTRTECFVERDRRGREAQKEILTRAFAGRTKRSGHGRQGISYRSKKTMKKNQPVRKK